APRPARADRAARERAPAARRPWSARANAGAAGAWPRLRAREPRPQRQVRAVRLARSARSRRPLPATPTPDAQSTRVGAATDGPATSCAAPGQRAARADINAAGVTLRAQPHGATWERFTPRRPRQ